MHMIPLTNKFEHACIRAQVACFLESPADWQVSLFPDQWLKQFYPRQIEFQDEHFVEPTFGVDTMVVAVCSRNFQPVGSMYISADLLADDTFDDEHSAGV